jgi:hypothetical protein
MRNGIGRDRAPLRARMAGLAGMLVAILGCLVPRVGAQVIPAAYPTSNISISTGYSGPYPYAGTWGAWFAYQGSNGSASSTFDGLGRLTMSRQDVGMLHAGYTNVAATTGVINAGVLDFTTPNTPVGYTIDGILPLTMTLGGGASAHADVWLKLAQVGGPTLAYYPLNQNFNLSTSLFAFDATAPLSGAQSGALLPNTNYQLSWHWEVGLTHNGNASANIDVAPATTPYFQISFVPEPTGAAAAAMGCAALIALRRRRMA